MMLNNKLSCFFWLLSAVIGLAVFVLFFQQAFPIASIDLRLNRNEVLKRAEDFISKQQGNLSGYDKTMWFDSDYQSSVYLQKTLGTKKANELIRQGIPVWFWSLRWFKELEKEGFIIDIDPATGEVISFNHAVLDDAGGANLALEEAKKIAQGIIAQLGIRLDEYELKDNTTKKQKNRTDYDFVWEKKGYKIKEATLRLNVAIHGDKLGYFNRYLKIPEEFSRDLQKDISLGQVFSIISFVLMVFLVIAAIVVLVIQIKKDKVNWKLGIISGSLIAILSIIAFINGIPLLWASYPDTMAKNIFITIGLGSALIEALFGGIIICLFGCGGDSLSRELWKSKLPIIDGLRDNSIRLAEVINRIIAGYSLGFVFLGYITLFYLISTKFFNVWMPPEAEYSDILTTSMPFLFPLTIALSAALSEEFMFRLFSISFFKKYLKFSWLGLTIPAIIWAFGHSNYLVFPAYIRGIELTIAGIVFGIVFLNYGLESVLIAHFVIDAVLAGLPLLKSQNFYFFISGAIVLALAMIPIPVLLILARKNRSVSKVAAGA